ncbi:MAG: hypothetical protein IPJ30_16540 [Acidobacteria bacterium]|nr:hypothetical protein [Acidobacteriota bacterium]
MEFFALDFAPSETIRYQYKLEGASTDWSKPSDNRNVNFASLAPGDYRLLVRSVNDSGSASEDPAVIVFKIK